MHSSALLWKEYRRFGQLYQIPPYEPFRLWGMAEFHGQYINNDDTEMGRVRRTVDTLPSGCDPKRPAKIWLFGGSTAYGDCAPDFATVPSYLSEKLNAQGACVEVTNLGVDAYSSNQELIYLIQQLKAGHRPNIVIFYDGANDTLVGVFDPGVASEHLNFEQIKAKFESRFISLPGLVRRSYMAQLGAALIRHVRPKPMSESRETSMVNSTLDNLEANLQSARSLGKTYGFNVYAFWQPTLLYGNKPRAPMRRCSSK